MVKVTNIKYQEVHFISNDKIFQQCLKYAKSITPDYEKYIPSNPKQKISFELESNVDMANCIRRYLIDEISVCSMHIDEDDIKTNDRFILSDHLKKNIELIPFNQDLEHKSLTISLNIENNTDDTIDVYSSDILIKNGEKKLDNSKYFSTTISIIKLRSKMSINIDDIKIVCGYGKKDAGKFALLANLSYEILDVEPLNESKFNKTGHSSLTSTPKHFKMELTTHRNIDIKKIMPLCCDEIRKKIIKIQTEISNIKNTDSLYFSNIIELETIGEFKLFHLKNEYWTISNIISRYCYNAFNDIPFVCSSVSHPSFEESIVKIKHSEPVTILLEALKNIITDISVIHKAF